MPDEGVIRFILQVLAVLLGGGSVQLIVRLLSRRSELRKVNSESDSVVVAAANNQVLRLEGEVQRLMTNHSELKKELDQERIHRNRQVSAMQTEHNRALLETQQRANAMVEEFRRENVRLNERVVELELQLSRAHAELRALRGKSPQE